MDAVLRAVGMYLVLLVIFRLTGKRTLAQVTMVDFVILLVVGEATAQALLGEDFSITHAGVVILTLIMLERLADVLTWRFPTMARTLDSAPILLVRDGVPLRDTLHRFRLDEDDVLAAGRAMHGLVSMEQIRYAVLESNGGISVMPWEQPRRQPASVDHQCSGNH